MRLGVDLGGTKIEIIAIDAAGHTLARERIPTPQGDYMATVMAIAGQIESIEVRLHQRGSVGVGIPGAESANTGLIKNANSTCLIGKPLRRDLQTVLRREVRLANDANCFALSEAVDGAAHDAETVFGVILGTGVGGGIVVHRQVLMGANHIAGEWGHNPLPAITEADLPARPCYCGRSGCIETYLSGPAVEAEYASRTGDTSSMHAIAQRAEAGEAAAQAVLDLYITRLARSLATVINLLDPDAIVLGGGLSHISTLYNEVPKRWGSTIFSDHIRTRLLPPVHGDASGVRGAAWLWPL